MVEGFIVNLKAVQIGGFVNTNRVQMRILCVNPKGYLQTSRGLKIEHFWRASAPQIFTFGCLLFDLFFNSLFTFLYESSWRMGLAFWASRAGAPGYNL